MGVVMVVAAAAVVVAATNANQTGFAPIATPKCLEASTNASNVMSQKVIGFFCKWEFHFTNSILIYFDYFI